MWRDPETKALPVVAGALVLTGTIFYWRFEDWTFIQALYFSVVTQTTGGYGDLHPTSAGTQICRCPARDGKAGIVADATPCGNWGRELLTSGS